MSQKAIIETFSAAVKAPSRAQILRLEDAIRTLPPVELITTHEFSKGNKAAGIVGICARTLLIPKNTALTGKIHRHENMNVFLKGDITVVTENGKKRFTEPGVVVSPRGVKRAAYAHEDTTWITFLATDETDIEAIERMFVAETYEEFEQMIAEEAKELKCHSEP